MLTAQEAREKLNAAVVARNNRIAVWVSNQLPRIEKEILQCVDNTVTTVYFTVDIVKEIETKDAPCLYAEALQKQLRLHDYVVDYTNNNTGYHYTLIFAENKKVYR